MEYHLVKDFDLQRYLGKWYEIARIEYRFERNMQGVTAEYSMRPDGKVRVLNRGHLGSPDGPLRTAEGKAKWGSSNDPQRPAWLKVSFWGPFYAPYYVLALDPDYRYALVAGKKHKYLWILSREPKLEQSIIQALIDIARQEGFDTSKLVFIRH